MCASRRIDCAQRFDNDGNAFCPERSVAPDVRVELSFEFGGTQQLLFRNAAGDRVHAAAAFAEAFKELGHLSFEMEA